MDLQLLVPQPKGKHQTIFGGFESTWIFSFWSHSQKENLKPFFLWCLNPYGSSSFGPTAKRKISNHLWGVRIHMDLQVLAPQPKGKSQTIFGVFESIWIFIVVPQPRGSFFSAQKKAPAGLCSHTNYF